MNNKRPARTLKKKTIKRKPITKKVNSKPLKKPKTLANTQENINDSLTTSNKKLKFGNNRFTFTGVFSEFKEKRNGYGDLLFGFIMTDIINFKTKKLFVESQWFNLGEGFKEAFESYSDKQLIGKTIKFNGFKVTEKKGYYEYRDNVLISSPDELEHKVLKPTQIKVV